ncbi:MAG: peptidoglycan DD-metalloendopeptidase family protein [Trueperaceae bacterium]|nr:peptidoglycan DD-metalloendopeptidase family protein [Trueperaceae bacterium]
MIRIFAFLLLSSGVFAQVMPDGVSEIPFVCPAPENQEPLPEPQSEEERLQRETRAKYRAFLPAFFAAVPAEPAEEVLMPVTGVRVRDIADTWGGARSEGRRHEGQDIFAPEGTAIYSGTTGFVYRIGENRLGGNTVVVVGPGGWRLYYAHLSAYAETLREGQAVTTDTLIGYVGNTGNAITTPPHLHLGIYTSEPGRCDWDAINPLPFLVDRP